MQSDYFQWTEIECVYKTFKQKNGIHDNNCANSSKIFQTIVFQSSKRSYGFQDIYFVSWIPIKILLSLIKGCFNILLLFYKFHFKEDFLPNKIWSFKQMPFKINVSF